MSKNNPRPEFMANLKTLCKDFDKQVNDLDLETRATLHHNRGKGNMAADKWRDEVLDLKSEISSNLATVTEERKNLSSFLTGVNDELRRLLENTQKCQDYMAQYGYKPKTIDTEALLDWTQSKSETEDPEAEQICDVAPPAASEFEVVNVKTEEIQVEDESIPVSAKKTPHKLQESSKKPSSDQDSPNIFDIGLSKYGMSLLLGKDITKPTPSQQSKHKPNPPPAVHQVVGETFVVKKPETPVQQFNAPSATLGIPDESTYDSSPILKLNSRSFPTFIDESTVDITPGLPSRKKSSQREVTNTNITPEAPQLVTDLARESKLRPESPGLVTDSPEMPEFTSNIMKTLMAAAKTQDKSLVQAPVTKSRPTPEFPQDLSFMKTDGKIVQQSNTPESPVLNFKYK